MRYLRIDYESANPVVYFQEGENLREGYWFYFDEPRSFIGKVHDADDVLKVLESDERTSAIETEDGGVKRFGDVIVMTESRIVAFKDAFGHYVLYDGGLNRL